MGETSGGHDRYRELSLQPAQAEENQGLLTIKLTIMKKTKQKLYTEVLDNFPLRGIKTDIDHIDIHFKAKNEKDAWEKITNLKGAIANLIAESGKSMRSRNITALTVTHLTETTFGHGMTKKEFDKLCSCGYVADRAGANTIVSWEEKEKTLHECKLKDGAINATKIKEAFPKAYELWIKSVEHKGFAHVREMYDFFDEQGICGYVFKCNDNHWHFAIRDILGPIRFEFQASESKRPVAETELFIKMFETLETKIILGEI